MALPYTTVVTNDLTERFRAAYWRAFRDAESLDLRQWEQSRIRLPQLGGLHHIRRRPGGTTRYLARSLGATVSTTSGLAIKLVERGPIERGIAADDTADPVAALERLATAAEGSRADDECDPATPLAGGAR